jgi:hypothetical protein
MQWCLVKTGAALFDLLHAYGLAILLAHACSQPIEVRETSCTYTLIGGISAPPSGSLALLDEVLSLPTPQEVEAAMPVEAPLPLANLDGLLTVLFTTPGVRILSVADLSKKAQHDQTLIERALKKVRVALARWKQLVSKEPSFGALSWLERLLHDYQPGIPALPVPRDAHRGRDLSLVMMLDPSFSYSTHRPRSDGLISHKTQIAIGGTRFAVLLATVGAARFLRAHRVAADLVNCYVPKTESVLLTHDSRLPLLTDAGLEASQAVLVQGLSYAHHAIQTGQTQWTGLCYQTIQAQGMQQSIPRGQGSLDLLWFTELPCETREPLLSFWRMLFAFPPERRACEIDALVDALSTRSLSHWATHLLDVARCVHMAPDTIRPYRLEEVKEVLHSMHASIPSLLKKALEQKTGTLRFGHALRLLGDANAAALRDLVEDLETATTLDQLLHILARTAQHCQVATAKTRFMVVPTEDDLGALLMDVEQSSVPTIARFLIVLSALRYPRLIEQEQDVGRLSRVISLLLTALVVHDTATGEAPEAPLQTLSATTSSSLNGERKGMHNRE